MLDFIQKKLVSNPKNALKVFTHFPESYWQKRAEKLKKRAFESTVRTVPAYRKFLQDKVFKGKKVAASQMLDIAWDAVPAIDKKEYLAKFPIEQLIPKQSVKDVFAWSQSSGYSGNAHYWPRHKGQDALTTSVANIMMTAFYSIDKISTLAVVGFSLGNWITGELVATVMRDIANKPNMPMSVITPGSDVHEMYRNIKDLGHLYEQVVVFGYPPLIRHLIDYGKKHGINWQRYNIKVVVTGETYTEEWRSYIRKNLGYGEKDDIMSVIGFYGAADAGLIGLETPASVLVRKLANQSVEMRKTLFGDERSVPSLVQFNPALRYIEQNNKKELILTGEGGLPLVKYNIHDKGGVIGFNEMVSRLSGLGIDFTKELNTFRDSYTDIWNWPFCFIFGRSDGAVSIDGANIYPESIQQALINDEFYSLVDSFRLEVIENARSIPKLAIHLQYTEDLDQHLADEEEAQLCEHFEKTFLTHLLEVNKDYQQSYADHPDALSPKVIFHLYGRGVFQNEQDKIKHKYV